MIRPSDKKAIIAVLGGHYSRKIVDYLISQKIFNEKGEPFSYPSISMIVNGKKPNEAVELAIANFLIIEKARKKELEETQTALFKAAAK